MPTIKINGQTFNIRDSAIGAKSLKIISPEGDVINNPGLEQQIQDYLQRQNTQFSSQHLQIPKQNKITQFLDAGKEFHNNNYHSAFDRTAAFEPIHQGFELLGKGINAVTDATGTTQAVQTIMPWFSPSQYVGWMQTGYRPGSEYNTGFGTSKDDQYLNEMFDLGAAPVMMKGLGRTAKAVEDLGKYKARVALYNNKNPFGYANDLSKHIKGILPWQTEVKNMIFDFANPFKWKPEEMPYWKKVMQSPENSQKISPATTFSNGATAEFRDMIYRQVLKLPETKEGTIFIKNKDGVTYGIDWDKANAIRKKWGQPEFKPSDNPAVDAIRKKWHENDTSWKYDNDIYAVDGTIKNLGNGHARFLSADNIAGVGGSTRVDLFRLPSGKNRAIMTDLWDVQPFLDNRSVWKWGSKHIPGLRNLEIIKTLGGEPIMTRFVVDNPNIQVMPQNNTMIKPIKKQANR